MKTLLKILGIFFQNPEKRYNIREVSIKSKVAYASCHRYLNELEKEKMMSKEKLGKAIYYKTNLQNLELLKHFELLEVQRAKNFFLEYKKEYAMLSRIIEGLGTDLCACFGSFARKEHTKESDIDLIIISGKKEIEKKIIERCNDFGITKGKEINPVFASAKEFAINIMKKEIFYKNLWKDRIIIKGEYLWWQTISKYGVPDGSQEKS